MEEIIWFIIFIIGLLGMGRTGMLLEKTNKTIYLVMSIGFFVLVVISMFVTGSIARKEFQADLKKEKEEKIKYIVNYSNSNKSEKFDYVNTLNYDEIDNIYNEMKKSLLFK